MKACIPAVLLFWPAIVAADFFSDAAVIPAPRPELFSVCYDHSCNTIVTDTLSPEEWRTASAELMLPLPSAADERHAVALAIAAMEDIVGRHTGTGIDSGGNLRGFGRPSQMDCIDESTNTNTYLLMFERDGLLKHHTVVRRSTRFGLFVGMPHTTAVIQANETQQRYAVDSWFHDNGKPPYIERLELWKAGGEPDAE
ncbi:MAG: hypothetical protein ACC648_00820 [Thiohalobacterales bacterium]